MSAASTTAPRVIAYQRRRVGVPQSEAGLNIGQRLLRSRWTWATALLLLGYLLAYLILHASLTAAVQAEDGSTIPGLNNDALWLSAKYAWPTLAVLSLLYLIADRYRPQRFLLWVLALGWGGLVAVTVSYFFNSWAGAQLAVYDWAPGLDSARIAIFIAPFVEEATKASVLFLIAFLDRGRITSRVSGVVLAGLSAVGFAFSENIVYYARVIVYGSYTGSVGEVKEALAEIVRMRGIFTCFGHPLFTMMTGIGLAIGVRHRSKIVRITAPLAGYLAAALLHMLFNTTVSLFDGTLLVYIYFFAALPLVVVMIVKVIRYALAQSRLIDDRLTDYVTMGWLPATYPGLFSRARTRGWALAMSLWHGNIIATIRLQRAVTELAYLRDAIASGVVDEGGGWREHELIGRIRALRSQGAIENPRGLRPYLWRPGAKKLGYKGPYSPGGVVSRPGGLQVGPSVQRYTAVDPRWGPPA